MIAVTSSGRSFRAIATYLAAGRSGDERDRVAWSTARNLPTSDPELAGQIMRATAAQNPRVEKPVYHLAISWDKADPVDRATMERVADRVLARLGLAEHEAVIVAHHDREHPHVHILVNRVHPETGHAWDRWQDQPTIERVLREEEQALGLRVVPGRLAPLPDRNRPLRIPADGLTSGERRAAQRTGEPAVITRMRAQVDAFRMASSWPELHGRLDAVGLRLERRGQGLIVIDGEGYQVKASRIGRDCSLRRLEERFGTRYTEHPRILNLGAERAAAARLGQEPSASLRDAATPPVIDAIKRDLDRWQRVVELSTETYTAQNALAAAEARVRQIAATVERAFHASQALDHALARMYRRPSEARARYVAVVHERGMQSATRLLREQPETFGTLQVMERPRALGLGRVHDDTAARAAVPEVVARAQEAIRAGAMVPQTTDLPRGADAVRAAVALDRSLATMYVDALDARERITDHAARHGAAATASVLMERPERFGVVRGDTALPGLSSAEARGQARDALLQAERANGLGLVLPDLRRVSHEVTEAERRLQMLREQRRTCPSPSILERSIRQAIMHALPDELRQIRALLAVPRPPSMTVRVRQLLKDAALGREGPER